MRAAPCTDVFGDFWLADHLCRYVWLLGRNSATRVSSHAYINPVVTMALEYYIAGDVIAIRAIFASLVIVLSVVLILTGAAKREVPSGHARNVVVVNRLLATSRSISE